VESLPEALEAHFRAVFTNDRRLPFPQALLSGSPWTQCADCGLMHGRRHCPRCHVQPPAPVVRRGTVSIQKIVSAPGVLVHTSIEGGRLSWIVWDGRRYLTETGATCPGPAYDGWVRIERQGQRVWIGRDGLVTGGREALRVDVMAGLSQFAASGDRLLRLGEGQLWEETPLGERQLGQVLPGRSYLWGGAGMALVYSEAGAISSAWLARSGRQGLTQAALPRRSGTLERIHCLFGIGCVWLLQARREQGRIQHSCLLFDDRDRLLASAEEEAGAGTWLDAPWGAMAAGQALYLPGDHLLRVSAVGTSLAVDREFPDTAPYVDSGVTLLPGPAGIYVVRRNTIHLLVQH
jgi:H/ACA ribonucleoprotein complex subunit 3